MRLITSTQNSALREARKLRQKKFRLQRQRFLIEGTRLVQTALRGGARVRQAFVTQAFVESSPSSEVLGRLEAMGADLARVPDEALRTLCETESPQGVVAVVDNVVVPLAQLRVRRNATLLVLEGIGDPGNLGTLIRTGWSQGAHGVIVTEGCCDPLNSKAIRASMGGLFHVPVALANGTDELVACLRANDVTLIGATCGQGVVCDRFNFPSSVALVIGSEAAGLSPAMKEAVVARVTIPERSKAESLNAAAAGAVLLYEIGRQRRARGAHAKAKPPSRPAQRKRAGSFTPQKGRPQKPARPKPSRKSRRPSSKAGKR